MTNYCDTSKLSIRQIDKPTAKKMVVKYHYSKLWTKCSVALGLFIDTGKEHSFFDEAEEKMSRELALRTYTINAAYAAFEDEIKGSIEAGKLADFTVLDKDIMSVDENNILETKIEMTIIGGEIVFSRN